MIKRKNITGIIGALLCATLLATGCGNATLSEAESQKPIKSVKAVTLSAEPYTESLDYLGYVAPQNSISLSFESSGTVEAIYVEEGEPVTLGQPIAKIDTDTLSRNLDNEMANVALVHDALEQYKLSASQLSLQLADARESFAKTESLYALGALSQVAYNQAKTSLDLLEMQYQNAQLSVSSTETKLRQAQLSETNAEESLSKATLIAPIDGYISDLALTVGETVNAGASAATVDSEDAAAYISVPVEDLDQLFIGQNVSVVTDLTSTQGIIRKIAQTPDASTRTYQVEIALPKSNFHSGTLLNVEIPLKTAEGYLVPLTAIININDIDYIYTLSPTEDNAATYRVSLQEVLLGSIYGDRVRATNIDAPCLIVSEGLKSVKPSDVVSTVE